MATKPRNPQPLVAGTLCVVLLAALAVAGCNESEWNATHMASARMDESRERGLPHHRDMADNAILHDMSVADIHFVPHTNELSGTGVARLDRMALMLDTYGGAVRYETMLRDEDLIASRVDHVREYLELTGCDMSRVAIQVALSGGRGMPAAKAIEAEAKVTTEEQAGGGAPLLMPTSGGGR